MRTGPLGHPVAFELPPGVDAAMTLYFVSYATGIECKLTIDGINQFAAAEHIVLEAERAANDPSFTKLASDWRLMTRAEVLDYRRRRQHEVKGADRHQEGERGGSAAG
jgi:hypothetical protein